MAWEIDALSRYVYSFGSGGADGSRDQVQLLGGKGANLAEMANLKIPVPPGFTISTEVCSYYYRHHENYPESLRSEVDAALTQVESELGRRFGDQQNPLLVSVRSGAPVSMPGMMDTVLNLGLNDETVGGLIQQTKNPRFAYDSFRRFVAMYGDVVLGVGPASAAEGDPFEAILGQVRQEAGVQADHELPAEALKAMVERYKALIQARSGQPFPDDPHEQLWGAIGAVFGSWHNTRAIQYRRMNRIPASLGTAVNVQAMVFGNSGEQSGTGVAFTRDPASGDKVFYGEYLINAQGEDVVAGVRTPEPIDRLAQALPQAYEELVAIYQRLERHYRDMLDLEFTVEDGRLWMLQARVGKRTGLAALKMAVDMVEEGLIDRPTALLRLDPEQLNQLLQPVFDATERRAAQADGRLLAKGIAAGPGAASGQVVFSAEAAVARAGAGEVVLLVRPLTSPEDIAGMEAAAGILTAQGGKTSHAALVARQMGKVCVVGCGALQIDLTKRAMRVGDQTIAEGDWLSVDGTSGEVILGRLSTRPSKATDAVLHAGRRDVAEVRLYDTIMAWSDEARTLDVRTNADQPDQAADAVAFGAAGIGLCRTEHMFFGEDRIQAMRRMILAETTAERQAALDQLLPMQRADFAGIFRAMAGRPVTIRLLDPPLHEFLPHEDEAIAGLASVMQMSAAEVRRRALGLNEQNPMLGHRGCRLGLTYPEVYGMQVRALVEAACDLVGEGLLVTPEIMMPLVGNANEMARLAERVHDVANAVQAERGASIAYQVGTMIEVPRACLVADAIAQSADFFSFGTNDLTQMTCAFSRDDVGSFLPHYLEVGVYADDPFTSIDEAGVGALMAIAVEKGRREKPALKLGICGEHGGDPTSIDLCQRLGLDYVSCSPLRVPIARLAAAQAALRHAPVASAV